jgi:hypothetical protein
MHHVSFAIVWFVVLVAVATAQPAGEWIDLFDGKSLDGWKAAENPNSWSVRDGQLVTAGPRSHLFYVGEVGKANFKNFELEVEVLTSPYSNSGVYVHTNYQETGWPKQGYEVQVCNAHRPTAKYKERKRTGSLYGVRNIYKTAATDGEPFRMRIRVVGKRIRTWVDECPLVDYIEPAGGHVSGAFSRRLSSGTIALQGHDPDSRVAYRHVRIRMLADDADPNLDDRGSDAGYGLKPGLIDDIHKATIPFIDYHVHLRGGMSIEKAMDRQAVTGINVAVLKNLGKDWPIETDQQLEEFLDSVDGKPLFVGLQVNDREWHKKHSPELLARLDFVLGDTMIMAMPDDEGQPQRLWMEEQYEIKDPEAWMKRYMKHNLRVLAEPITILANPTYLPNSIKDRYDELWTDERMRQVIQAAIDNDAALEINASSEWPHDRFIKMAKQRGAKFSFGSNNFNDKPIDLTRCFEAIDRYGLKKGDFYIPEP